MSKLYVVGIGPGSYDYMTFKAKKIVESVDVLVGSIRALNLFSGSHGEKLELNAKNMEDSFKKAVLLVQKGKNVALLSTGDPGFSGVLKPVLNLAREIEVEVVPGVSSIQLCAARLEISWDETNLITLHGKGVSSDLFDALGNGKPTILLPNFSVRETAGFLLESGVNPDREVAICERLSYPDERIVKTKLKDVSDDDFSYMCVMVIFN
ncbi:MAG TPA: precorrin-6y C5,15-methyltransferase (decarboxylating) subunit CbiE [Methanobacterium sp.]|nr:precorrin-6y C5,15-methyltransferase (decarboxylating) subunit CbiE [Methanobacterium sp.]